MKKLKIAKVKVQSFTTNLNTQANKTINGGLQDYQPPRMSVEIPCDVRLITVRYPDGAPICISQYYVGDGENNWCAGY